MKKVIRHSRELMEWCKSITLDNDFILKVAYPRVTYHYSEDSFDIEGVLSVNEYNLADCPAVLKKADALYFYAMNNVLKFRAHFQAEPL